MALTSAPIFVPIRGGWAALGIGWAVFGETQEQAADRFREAEHKHREIMERPEPMAWAPTVPQSLGCAGSDA